MNGIRGKNPASPPPQVQGQQQQRGLINPYVEEYNPNYQQVPQSQPQQLFNPQQFSVATNYDVSKNFGAPRMPSPGLGQQPPTTMYQQHQPQQGMNRNSAPFFQGNQQNVRQPRFPNMQHQNQPMWNQMNQMGQMMYIPYGPQGNTAPIVVNPLQVPQQRMPYNPSSNMPSTQATSMSSMYQGPPTNMSYNNQGYNNPTIFYPNTTQSRPPSAPTQPMPMQPKKKTMLKIIDPNTGQEVVLGSSPADSGQRSTPVSTSNEPNVQTAAGAAAQARSPPNKIAAQFAEQVAEAIYKEGPTGSYKHEPHHTSPGPQQQQQHPPQQQQHAPPQQQHAPPQQQQQHAPPPQQQQQHAPPPNPISQQHQQQHPPPQMPQMSQHPPGQMHQHMPPHMPNDVHGGHVDGRMQPVPHMGHPAGHPAPSAPISIPVNPTRPPMAHVEVNVAEMPPNTDPRYYELANHTDVESIEPPAAASITSVPSQSQNGTAPAQKPVQNISIHQQQTASSSESSKPSDVKQPLGPGPVRETSPTKPTPAPVKEPEHTHSLSRGEPVTVSVAKPVAEQTVAPTLPSDSVKTVTHSKRGSTPEVNIVPPTPVEKEAKVELEAPVSKPQPDTSEPTQEAAPVPKKEKAKKRGKNINSKGEKMGGSEFDAYVDKKEEAVPEPKVEVSEKLSPEPEVAVPAPAPEREASPVVVPTKEEPPVVVNVTSQQAAPPAPVVEPPKKEVVIPKTEIKIEDVDVPAAVDDVSTQDEELEEGEIEDDGMEEVTLKYKYLEDQWSPLNIEGKKHYDREFLLQFQYESAAVSKPEGLPDIPDIILDKPLGVGPTFTKEMVKGVNRNDADSFDFTPNYVWSSGGQGGGGSRNQSKNLPRQPSNQRNKSQQGGGGGPQPKQINLSISKDIELHKAKEAWKPAVNKDAKKKETTENPEDPDDLYKKTRSILNKLTPQKFQTLVSQMQALPIDSETKLKGVIDLVFEKAISEPNFSVAYANMCRCLSMFKVPSENKPREQVNFRAVLLTRCQREFEKDKSSEIIFKEKREKMEAEETGKKKDEMKALLEYEETQAKRRSLGNIRFIGELFKLKMLTENIMHDCVFKLLRTKDPENLECLCRLLTTIGKELDVDKAKPRMDQYFQQMTKIINDKKMSSRVRFMLQDVVDLRMSKWVPRRVDNNPKTIDQIHKEMEREAQEKSLLAQQNQFSSQNKTPHGGGGGRGGRRPPPGQMGGGGGSDGWNTVGGGRSTPLRSVDRSIDPSKIRFSKQNVDESNIQLGPGGGASRFAGWGRGSTGGTSGGGAATGGRPSQEKEKPNTPANRFSVLNKPEDDSSRRYAGTSPARGDSKNRGGFGRPPSASRQSQETEREKALSAAKAIGGRPSAEAPRERSRGREPNAAERMPAPAAPGAKEFTSEEMEKKANSILDEYLHIQDLKEAILCVEELSPNNHHHFVYHAINHVIERSQVARQKTGHLLHDFVKRNVIPSSAYLKGLLDVLEFAEDMEIDIPMIWQYYGELISPMIQDGSIRLGFLKDVCQPLLASNKAGVLLSKVLKEASTREGHKKVAGLWADSGLQWTDFVPKNQVEQFLKDNDLEFTKGGDSAPTTPTTGLPLTEISDKLHLLIVVQAADNETVFDWIESNVDEPTTKQAKFIRALMTAVCNSAIKGDKGKERVEPKEINTRNDLLQKYLDHQPDSELQALYALQVLVAKLEHPQGVLRQMFDTLYDEDIISEDAFIQWEKSEEEPEGKGAALKQVVQFFTWLREAEDDS